MKTYSNLSRWNYIVSLIILLALSLVALVFILAFSVNAVNEESRSNIEEFLSAVIAGKLRSQAKLAKDYAYWDATIENAYLSEDINWIQRNIGQYLTDTFYITDLLLLDPDDQFTLVITNGQITGSSETEINKQALDTLAVRARLSGTVPEPTSGILMIEDVPALVGMSVLAPKHGEPFDSPRPLLVAAIRMNNDYLDQLAEQYRLDGLRFDKTPDDVEGFATLALDNPNGVQLGKLVWLSENPGSLVLDKIRILLLVLFALVLFATAAIIKAARQSEIRLREAYRNLSYSASHDSLTGLANRRLFAELLEQSVHTTKRNDQHCAILYIDLDNFKQINDKYGHRTGDRLLVTTADRIKSAVRESDVVARLGGDEFIVLLQNVDINVDVKHIAEKLIYRVSQPISYIDNQAVSASIGVALIQGDDVDPDVLISRADSALLESKRQGKNTFNFYTD